MKISNSKKQLAKIIHENGGWREGNYAVQDKDDKRVWFMRQMVGKPSGRNFWPGVKSKGIPCSKVLPNWHQTILSREEFSHLYPAPDADGWIEWIGGERPVGAFDVIEVRYRDYFNEVNHIGESRIYDWAHHGSQTDIIAYRLHKPEKASAAESLSDEAVSAAKDALMSESIEELARKPTIEQLAANYRNLLDFARRKQQEADDAKADADEAMRKLELAGGDIGLIVTSIAARQEPELVINDWRDLRVGDEVEIVESCSEERVGYIGVITRFSETDEKFRVRVHFNGNEQDYEWISKWRFIRRP